MSILHCSWGTRIDGERRWWTNYVTGAEMTLSQFYFPWIAADQCFSCSFSVLIIKPQHSGTLHVKATKRCMEGKGIHWSWCYQQTVQFPASLLQSTSRKLEEKRIADVKRYVRWQKEMGCPKLQEKWIVRCAKAKLPLSKKHIQK